MSTTPNPTIAQNAKCQGSLSIDEWVVGMDHCPGARVFAESHVAAVHESGNGTNRTSRAGLAMSVDWGRPEVTG
jgi:hypothetical protein